MTTRKLLMLCVLAMMVGGIGCFYPPPEKPPAPEKDQVELNLPYDLAWTAVNAVIENNGYKVSARDPNNGIIEAQTTSFTLKDADCGEIKGIAGRFAAEPGQDASAVYNFYVKPSGTRSSLVTVSATFSAPLQVPLQQKRHLQCVSRGVQETRLLSEVEAQAKVTHRPSFTPPSEENAQSPAKIGGRESITNPFAQPAPGSAPASQGAAPPVIMPDRGPSASEPPAAPPAPVLKGGRELHLMTLPDLPAPPIQQQPQPSKPSPGALSLPTLP